MIFHVDKYVLFTFTPPIIPLIYVPGHDLNSNISLNLDASLSLISTMDVIIIISLLTQNYKVFLRLVKLYSL